MLAVVVIVFTWPALAARLLLPPPSFPWLTIAFAIGLAACIRLWPREPAVPGAVATRNVALGVLVSGVAVVALSYTLVEWVGTMIALPFTADMLVVIREGTRRFLDGANPYTTYRTYDAPWDMVLPYGPLLWGPYLAPQALHADLRIVTITGELAVPACAAVAAAVEAMRGRVVASLTWLGLLASLILSLHLTAFTLMGHTAAYWPLLPLFAWLVTMQRWPAAALVLGLLVVARTPMVAVVPVLFLTVWTRDRTSAWRAAVLFALPVVVLFTPFLLWDASALWHNMVTSYPRIVKAVVWVPPAEGVVNTIGLTGWLVARGLERWVEATEILALVGIYAAAGRAIGRGAAPVPWMAAALAVFCMTALWPVFYIYFDVVLLLAAGAAAETLGRRLHPLEMGGRLGRHRPRRVVDDAGADTALSRLRARPAAGADGISARPPHRRRGDHRGRRRMAGQHAPGHAGDRDAERPGAADRGRVDRPHDDAAPGARGGVVARLQPPGPHSVASAGGGRHDPPGRGPAGAAALSHAAPGAPPGGPSRYTP